MTNFETQVSIPKEDWEKIVKRMKALEELERKLARYLKFREGWALTEMKSAVRLLNFAKPVDLSRWE